MEPEFEYQHSSICPPAKMKFVILATLLACAWGKLKTYYPELHKSDAIALYSQAICWSILLQLLPSAWWCPVCPLRSWWAANTSWSHLEKSSVELRLYPTLCPSRSRSSVEAFLVPTHNRAVDPSSTSSPSLMLPTALMGRLLKYTHFYVPGISAGCSGVFISALH